MNKSIDKSILVTTSLIGFTAIMGVLLSSVVVRADESVDTLTVTVDSACTMTATGGNNGSFSATISPGTSSEIAGSTLTTVCNDAEGYSIYAVGYSGDSYDAPTNTQMIGTNSSSINTGTTGPDSYWAMKLSAVTGITPPTILNSFDDYHVIPEDYTQIAKYTSNTSSSTAEGAAVKTNYKISTSSSQTAGTYTGKVKYVMVHPNTADAPEVPPQPAEPGKIVYHANASDVVGTMGDQDLIIARDWSSCRDTDYETYCYDSNWNEIDITTLPELDYYSNTLYASNFKRDGYGFAGWSDAYDYTTNPNAHFYGPIETITTPSDLSTNGLSLYAIWIPSAGSLQSDGASTCNSLTKAPAPGGATTANLSSVSALTDDRDGNTYAIAKLADNKCWIIENLRLADKDSNNNDINLSSTNTHNPSLPLTNSWYYKNRQGTRSTSNHLSATSDPNSTNPDTAWCQATPPACIDQSMLATNNTTLFTSNTSTSYDPSSNVYSYGNYYNWYSATAGHGKYENYNSGYLAPGDICPAGWHLPRSGDKPEESTNEFWQLIVTGLNNGVNPANYNDDSTSPHYIGKEATPVSNALRSYPNNFLYSGAVYGSSVINRSSQGSYWSSSEYDSHYTHSLHLGSSVVAPGTGVSYKYFGDMVRCVIGV